MWIFVYGTLKQGCHNNRLLQPGRFVTPDTIRGYTLYEYSGIPIAVPSQNGFVEGEVWEISFEALQMVDALEGHPHLYRRTSVVTDNKYIVEMYVWAQSQLGPNCVPIGSSWPVSIIANGVPLEDIV